MKITVYYSIFYTDNDIIPTVIKFYKNSPMFDRLITFSFLHEPMNKFLKKNIVAWMIWHKLIFEIKFFCLTCPIIYTTIIKIKKRLISKKTKNWKLKTNLNWSIENPLLRGSQSFCVGIFITFSIFRVLIKLNGNFHNFFGLF